jgi:hypothetical protein
MWSPGASGTAVTVALGGVAGGIGLGAAAGAEALPSGIPAPEGGCAAAVATNAKLVAATAANIGPRTPRVPPSRTSMSWIEA